MLACGHCSLILDHPLPRKGHTGVANFLSDFGQHYIEAVKFCTVTREGQGT